MLFSKGRGAVHQHHELHNAFDPVQIRQRSLHRAHKVNGYQTSGLFALLGREIHSKLSGPGLAVLLSDMTGQEKQITSAIKRHKSGHWRRQFRKRDVESLELFIYAHLLYIVYWLIDDV